ncbi:rhamnulokinase [Clostridium sp. AWRP]|uniref:rhamnulokinase n=1 Tax=Clostridium sp. AWRP TaxID=2212991 RepID=UPI000FD74FD4|nr:rhamnulokinase [Clostridium sp. AWRP]AZV58928.1 rhamnulokinase [Clostridium sp. AWRP]
MKFHIAVDIGASSGRLVLGKMLNSKIVIEEIHRFKNKIIRKDGEYFWNIDNLYNNIIIGLQKAAKLGIDKCTLGIDTWAVDYVLLDKHGNRISKVYSYRDERTKNAIEEFSKLISLKEIYKKTGIQFLNFNTLYQLYVHNKDELKQAEKILLIPDYLYYLLTGNYINEITNASTTQLLNLETKEYDRDLLNILDLKRSQFAKLIQPGQNVGSIKQSLKEKYNLPECTLISVATHDTGSAVLGVPGCDENFAYLSSGTWSLLGIEMNKPINNKVAFENNYTNERGAFNTYRFLKNIIGLWLIQEVRRNYNNKYSFSELVNEALKVQAFKYIINCNDCRFLKPENMIEEIQRYCKESGQNVPHTAGEISRCVFDSLALTYRRSIEELEEVTGNRINTLNIVGGGVQNKLLCQTTSDVIEREVIAGPVESTALGNIMVQMISSFEIENIIQARKLIRQSFKIDEYNPCKVKDLNGIYERFLKLCILK